MHRPERRMRPQQPFDAVVAVLVDDHDAERSMRLAFERVQQRSQVLRPVDGRDDEIEADARRFRHRCRLPSASSRGHAPVPPRNGPPRGARRRSVRRRGDHQRARPDARRPRVPRRRRRVDRRYARYRRAPRAARRTHPGRPKRSSARPRGCTEPRAGRGARAVRRPTRRRRRRAPATTGKAGRRAPGAAGSRGARHLGDGALDVGPGRRSPDAPRSRRRSLGCAVLCPVLPPDRRARPRRAEPSCVALRRPVPRERGLRPLGTDPRGRRRRQPARGLAPLPAAHRAGIGASKRAAAFVPARGCASWNPGRRSRPDGRTSRAGVAPRRRDRPSRGAVGLRRGRARRARAPLRRGIGRPGPRGPPRSGTGARTCGDEGEPPRERPADVTRPAAMARSSRRDRPRTRSAPDGATGCARGAVAARASRERGGRRLDPRDARLPRAHAVSDGDARPDRRDPAGARPHRPVCGEHRAATDVDDRAAPSRSLPRGAPCAPVSTARCATSTPSRSACSGRWPPLGRRSSSSPVGAPSPLRRRPHGAVLAACRTSCSSSRTSATRGGAGDGPSRASSSRRSSDALRRFSS